MKKLFSILALATVLSCTPEPADVKKDCNCNRVVDVISYSVVGTNSGKTYYYKYTTINDCSGLQRSSGFGFDNPKIGDCR